MPWEEREKEWGKREKEKKREGGEREHQNVWKNLWVKGKGKDSPILGLESSGLGAGDTR